VNDEIFVVALIAGVLLVLAIWGLAVVDALFGWLLPKH
jgi:hypothetical protein